MCGRHTGLWELKEELENRTEFIIQHWTVFKFWKFWTQKGTKSYQRHLPDVHEMVLTDSDESDWILDGFQAKVL